MEWTPIPKVANVELTWLGRLIDSIGTPDMSFALLEAVNELVPVEEIAGFMIEEGAALSPFGASGRRADSERRAKSYAARLYRHDPLMHELSGQHAPGMMMVRVDRASRIRNDQYRWESFDEPCFGSRVSIARTQPQGWSTINFYLADDVPSDHAIDELSRFSVGIYPACRRHLGLAEWEQHAPTGAPCSIEGRLAERFPTLTPRERTICARTLSGQNSRAIAQTLGISAATVLTYRRRAYGRLGIHNASQLVQHLF